ncbi:MAG: type I-E CRISPR-associated protein Cas5/CasD [Nitrospinota bacterium]|nr:type I-E CRISPR-associated protein Cas5/CasD [Nitrospinota bacterium]
MREFLLFHLYGPMASWGDIAVGVTRPSFAHPTRSAMLGLVAAAMGVDRDDEEAHQNLSSSLRFAFRVSTPGIILRDYHTIQVPPAKDKIRHYTRKSELETGDLNTILSSRDYYCDAIYTICLWTRGDSPLSLAAVAQSLAQPTYTLYLGRKSCPPAMPLAPRVLTAATIKEAFAQAEALHQQTSENGVMGPGGLLDDIPSSDIHQYYWEELDGIQETGFETIHINTRRDTPISRARWQFTERDEFYTSISAKQEG